MTDWTDTIATWVTDSGYDSEEYSIDHEEDEDDYTEYLISDFESRKDAVLFAGELRKTKSQIDANVSVGAQKMADNMCVRVRLYT